MGAIWSLYWLRPRRIFIRPETNRQATRNSPYKYPPAEGSNYFGPHFYLGNCKFNSPSPEVFLFGENSDLNYLGTQPVTFPYKPDRKLRATRTLRSLINVQKDSVKIVKTDVPDNYTIEFTFDSDVDCCFRILYCLRDDVNLCELTNVQLHDGVCKKWSPLFHYKSGAGQTFSQPDHILDAAQMSKFKYDAAEGGEYPLVILMETVGTISSAHQLQATTTSIDELGENSHALKVLKQMLCVDGIAYMLQEIYGLENKSKSEDHNSSSDEEDDDEFQDAIEEGSECVICFSEIRDTLILPCRHFCICTTCASSLRYQASNCPICRAPFHALLSLTALEEIEGDDPDEICNQQNTNIPGYRSIPLMQALNGYPLEQNLTATAGETTGDRNSIEDAECLHENAPEQIDILPIEVPLSPPGNEQQSHVTVECNLPGALTRTDVVPRAVETISSRSSVSASDNDASSKEIELSETSSNVSGESNTLLLSSKPENTRGSAKKKKFLNNDRCRSDQMDVELRVIRNGNALDQDNTQTASC